MPTLKDKGLEDNFQKLIREELEGHLIQAKKITEEKRVFLKKTIQKIKVNFFPTFQLFKLDLQFFNNKKEEELEEELKEIKKDLNLAAEIGKALLEKNSILERENEKLKREADVLNSKLQSEISSKESAVQLEPELVEKNEELTREINTFAEQLERSAKEIDRLDNIIYGYEKQKEN